MMVTLNTRIVEEGIDYPLTGRSVVGARFGVDRPISLSVTRYKGILGGYSLAVRAEGDPQAVYDRGLNFDATPSGFSITVRTTEDIEQIKAALVSAAITLELLEDPEGYSAEEVGSLIGSSPNRKQHESIFHDDGEPRQQEKLFSPDGQYIHKEMPFPLVLNQKHKLIPTDDKREFNHLRITNLNQFLSSYENNVSYYASPFKILAELEDRIKYQDIPDEHISIPYSENGDMLFERHLVYQSGGRRVVEYTFTTSAWG